MTRAISRAPEDDDFRQLSVPVQKVQTKYTTAMAVQVPRKISEVEARSLSEAAILGADAYYAWGAGENRIEGPSKELAMSLVRCYGNCAVDLGEVQETREAWIFTATFVDLETGFTLSRQFRQSKAWKVYGKLDDDRKDDMRFQIGQTKAVRNVILNALPGWLVTRAMDKAKGGVREKIEAYIAEKGMDKAQTYIVEKLAKLGAPEARVLEAMGRKVRAALTVEDIVIMQGSAATLEAGADTVDALFPVKQAVPEPPAEGASRADALLSGLKSNSETVEIAKKIQEAATKEPTLHEDPNDILAGTTPIPRKGRKL